MSESGVVESSGQLSPPIPGDHPMHQFYWDAVKAGHLELLRCQRCRHFIHYPRPICRWCRSTELAPEEISGRGTLYSYTVLMQAGHPYFVDKVPYIIGVLEIDEEPGVRLPGGIDAVEEELRCGIPLETVFKAATPTLTLPYFRPATRSGQ
jgi:uncharacterized OB-fold protein